jgi:hypothetical protein
MSTSEYIPMHRQLVYFLSQFEAFKVDDGHEGQPLFKMRRKYVSSNFAEEISVAQVNGAAEVVATLFNLVGPSVGLRFDLRKLLQAYLRDEGKREEINKLL